VNPAESVPGTGGWGDRTGTEVRKRVAAVG